jgi:hypothetical protein
MYLINRKRKKKKDHNLLINIDSFLKCGYEIKLKANKSILKIYLAGIHIDIFYF